MMPVAGVNQIFIYEALFKWVMKYYYGGQKKFFLIIAFLASVVSIYAFIVTSFIQNLWPLIFFWPVVYIVFQRYVEVKGNVLSVPGILLGLSRKKFNLENYDDIMLVKSHLMIYVWLRKGTIDTHVMNIYKKNGLYIAFSSVDYDSLKKAAVATKLNVIEEDRLKK